MVKLPPFQHAVIIGLILSDGSLAFASKTNKNARLGLEQSASHLEYLLFIFTILSHYCASYPVHRIRYRTVKANYSVLFYTRSLPCLTEIHSLFYKNGNKLIPDNIYELLTPVTLAHLIQGDGSRSRHGLVLCTDSYSIEDIVRLMNVLIIRYRLNCTLRFHTETQPRIYIREGSMSLLRTIVIPYMHTSMLYKISAGRSQKKN
jgi:hypothetical protein